MFKKIQKRLLEATFTLIFTLIFCHIINSFVTLTTVQGTSMQPTLQNGDKLLINKIPKMMNKIERGDIVVFDSTPGANNKDKVFYIKRVIGISGDTVEIKHGNVFVNGEEISEQYADKTNSFTDLKMTVPDNSYFVLGDNRDKSNDSRYFGTILHNQIEGKISMQLVPKINFDKFK